MKKNTRNLVMMFVGLLLGVTLLAGCGSTVASTNVPKPSVSDQITQPVTLTVDDLLFTDDEWQKYVVAPIQAKYPNVTLQRIKKTTDYQSLINSGQLPDIFFAAIASAPVLTPLGIPLDLTNLIKKHNADLSAIDPVVVDGIKKYSDKGQMIAMPLYTNIQALFYNKAIFDKFGVPYPTDNMSNAQVLNVARSVTRTADGINFIGLNPGNLNFLLAQLSLDYIDKKTNQVLVNTQDGFKKVFNWDQSLYSIPGMQLLTTGQAKDDFYKTQNLAMNVDWLSNQITLFAQGQTVNWDMVTMPYNVDRPGIGSMTDFHAAYISSSSQNQDAAFSVINYLSTSTAVQTLLVKGGRPTILKDKSIDAQFGADLDFLKGKNLSVVAKTNMAPLRNIHPLENAAVGTALTDALTAVAKGTKDVNTALSDAQDTITKNLAKAQQSQ